MRNTGHERERTQKNVEPRNERECEEKRDSRGGGGTSK